MSDLKTMFQLSGRVHAPANLSNATLIIIDAQKEYLSGPLALTGVDEALANIGQLVAKARAVKCPIVHVRHLGTVGGLFDPQGERGQLVRNCCRKATNICRETPAQRLQRHRPARTAAKPRASGPGRVRVHESFEHQHHGSCDQGLRLSLHTGRRCLRNPRPAKPARCCQRAGSSQNRNGDHGRQLRHTGADQRPGLTPPSEGLCGRAHLTAHPLVPRFIPGTGTTFLSSSQSADTHRADTC